MIDVDNNRMDLLSTFHYVVGGIVALFSCMPFVHVVVGLAMVSGNFFDSADGSAPPDVIGWLFVVMGAVAIAIGWTLAVCMFVAGTKLKNRTNRMFCMVIAGFECLFMPLGTVLGIFTLILLNQDSIKTTFTEPT